MGGAGSPPEPTARLSGRAGPGEGLLKGQGFPSLSSKLKVEIQPLPTYPPHCCHLGPWLAWMGRVGTNHGPTPSLPKAPGT